MKVEIIREVLVMSDYIGKKMSDHEARELFADGFVVMHYENDPIIDDAYGEILWYGRDEGEAYKRLGAIEEIGHFGVIPGAEYYKNSLGGIF
jgi:hypothetical protein